MSGTRAGGLKAAKKNKELKGEDFYKHIGAKGGRLGKTGGFASDKVGKDGLTGRERARKAGSRGGTISQREDTIHVLYNGRTVSLRQYSKLTGVAYSTAYDRFKKGRL